MLALISTRYINSNPGDVVSGWLLQYCVVQSVGSVRTYAVIQPLTAQLISLWSSPWLHDSCRVTERLLLLKIASWSRAEEAMADLAIGVLGKSWFSFAMVVQSFHFSLDLIQRRQNAQNMPVNDFINVHDYIPSANARVQNEGRYQKTWKAGKLRSEQRSRRILSP